MHVLFEQAAAVCFAAHQNDRGVLTGNDDLFVTGSAGEVTITHLKPETGYEARLLAINGKGEGEWSPAEFFKTEPVRKSHAMSSIRTITDELKLIEEVESVRCCMATHSSALGLFGQSHKSSPQWLFTPGPSSSKSVQELK